MECLERAHGAVLIAVEPVAHGTVGAHLGARGRAAPMALLAALQPRDHHIVRVLAGREHLGLEQLFRREQAVVIMLTGDAELENAVEAMRRGAENFIAKPVKLSHLEVAVEKAAEKASYRREVVKLRAQLSPGLKKRLIRYVALALIMAVSLVGGTMIGRMGQHSERLASPIIPIPLDRLEIQP